MIAEETGTNLGLKPDAIILGTRQAPIRFCRSSGWVIPSKLTDAIAALGVITAVKPARRRAVR
jgi:hypothetical protein